MISKKRIAIIGVGVIGIPVLTEILKRLASHFCITVYSFIPVDRKIIPDGIKVKCLPRFKIHQRLQYIVLGAWFMSEHFKSPYQIIHAQSAFPGGVMARFLGKLFNIPWILTLIGGEVECMPEIPFGDLQNKRLIKVTHKVCSDASILTVMSKFQATSVRNNLRIDRSIEVLPYAPLAATLEKKQITFPVQILHIAYHHPVKNHDMLLSTMVRISAKCPVHLTIVGENYGEDFFEKIRKLNLQNNIKLVGQRPYHEVEKLCRDSHILLHTSWYEGLPTVAFEAMACGAVVCGTHVGIMSDLSGTHCLTVEPNNDQHLAEVVLELIQNSEKYERLRSAAFNWALANDANHYVNRMNQLYNEISLKD